MFTRSGRMLDLLNPDPSQINLQDISHALSRVCRYAGNTEPLYTVAQHSLLVSAFCSQENKLWGLLHDAAEAYLGDVPKPVKDLCPDYRAIEARIERAVADYFGLPYPIPVEVMRVDKLVAAEELSSRILFRSEVTSLFPPAEKLNKVLIFTPPLGSDEVEEIFLSTYLALAANRLVELADVFVPTLLT